MQDQREKDAACDIFYFCKKYFNSHKQLIGKIDLMAKGYAKIDLWSRTDKKIHHSNRIFKVISFNSTSPDKKISGDFYSLETNDWVNIIPITREGKVILVSQYRHGLHTVSLEFPGGIVEKGQHLQTAKNELMEETGYSSRNWTLLGKMAANPAFLNNWNYSYVAENCEPTGVQNLDPNEQIEIELFPLQQIPQMIQSGKIYHSMMISIAGLFFMHPEFKDKYKLPSRNLQQSVIEKFIHKFSGFGKNTK